MKVCLLDVNTLVALLWTNHEQHEAARAWFLAHQRGGWATCPLTQTGFIRVSSNPRVFPDAPSPGKAAEILAANLGHANHHFWKDEIPFAQAVAPLGRVCRVINRSRTLICSDWPFTSAARWQLLMRRSAPCSIRSRRRTPWKS